MRFPSIRTLADRATVVARRFPWTLAAAVAAAALAIASAESSGVAQERLLRIAVVVALGIAASFAITMTAEAKRWGTGARIGAQLVVAGGLALFHHGWHGPDRIDHAIRFAQLGAVLHLAAAFLPFLGSRDSAAFWQYNRRLFLGFLRAAVFSAVLFVGIAIALAALDRLFGVDVEPQSYLDLWLVCAFVANTWIFLGAVPEDLAALEHEREYPKALKVFAQYVLTPLAFGYLVILLAYLVKIVLGGEWPSGYVGWLVASVAVAGLLGFLLVHPLRGEASEGWIRLYARWLFVGLIPAALMLLVAFWKRIEPYGLTELRVLGFLLGCWLLAIAVAFTLRQDRGIRVIPLSLAVLLLATLAGPTGLTAIAVRSQEARLRAMLALEPKDEREASGALRFLIERGAFGAIEAAVGGPLPARHATDDATRRWSPAHDSLAVTAMRLAGATYQHEFQGPRPTKAGGAVITGEWDGPLAVTGYDWAVPVSRWDRAARLVAGDTVQVIGADSLVEIAIRIGADTLRFDAAPFAAALATGGSRAQVPDDTLRLAARPGTRPAVLQFSQFEVTGTGAAARLVTWQGRLLFGTRRPDGEGTR